MLPFSLGFASAFSAFLLFVPAILVKRSFSSGLSLPD